MTYQTPCSSPENNPDDWFINASGKQYAEDFDDLPEDEAAEQVKVNLAARQHAKHLCFERCIARVDCLRRGLDEGHAHGIWGGYFEEEMREIRKEQARRKSGEEE